MKVLVLGSEGLLGTDLVRAGEHAAHEVRGFGRLRLDVTDLEAVRARLRREVPDAVINCAAVTDVDQAEEDPGPAMQVNATGAANVAVAAAEVEARVLYVSTSFVFDGSKSSPYVETDPVAPLNRYGQSKAAGEEATLRHNRRSWVVRTAGLFGVHGPNFVEKMLEIGRLNRQVLVARDLVTSPTWTWHLANALIRLLDSNAYGLHHMAATGYCSRYELAVEAFSQAGLDVVTLSTTSDGLGRTAKRPAFSALTSQSSNRIELPSWQDGLAGYLAQVRAEGGEPAASGSVD